MASLTARAEAILAQAKEIDALLERHKLAPPSYQEDTLDQLPEEMQDARWKLANECNELKKLTRGAMTGVVDISMLWTDALALRVVYRYKLAKAVPLDGTASYAEIAAASGLSENLCRRFMRVAMSSNIFDEDVDTQRVRHTAASRHLATDPGLDDAVGLELDDIAPGATRLIDVWDKYGQDIDEPEKSAYCMYNGTTKPVFKFFADHPERARRFGGAMAFFTRGDTWNVRHLLASFDWASIDQSGAVVVDIAGGHGQLSRYLATHTKNIHFIVQDLPYVVETASSQIPAELRNRIEYKVHDFFTPQATDPPPAAFLLRWILHDWSDKYAIQILRNLVPALRKGSKVLIYEYVLEDHPVTDLSGRFGFQMDGIMATFFNAQERNAREYEQLIKTTDERFSVRTVNRPPGSTMSIVEVDWLG